MVALVEGVVSYARGTPVCVGVGVGAIANAKTLLVVRVLLVV